MRETEFRAWLKDEKKMVEVKEIIFVPEKQIAYDAEYRNGKSLPFHYLNYKLFNDIELIEYTGLKDKNGVKIFEGDVFIDEDDGCIGVIRYSEQFAWFIIEWYENSHSKEPLDDDPLGHINVHNMEVIGNIYENPELLEVEND